MIDYARPVRVALFVTCLADTLYPSVGRATVTVLERLGVEVVFPRAQTCCGQLHVNAGYPDVAAALAVRFVEVFAGFDAVVDAVRLVRGARPLARARARRRPGRRGREDLRALTVPRRPPGSHGRRLRRTPAR